METVREEVIKDCLKFVQYSNNNNDEVPLTNCLNLLSTAAITIMTEFNLGNLTCMSTSQSITEVRQGGNLSRNPEGKKKAEAMDAAYQLTHHGLLNLFSYTVQYHLTRMLHPQ